MKKLIERGFIYIGHALFACVDLAAGMLIVSVVGFYSGIEIPLFMYAAGALLAVVPDADLLGEIFKAKDLKGWDHHQTLTHKPIIMLPVFTVLGALVGFLLGNIFLYAGIFFLCVFWHYLHDTKELGGGGVAWFWPVSRKYWSFTSVELPEDSVMGKHSSYPMWIHPSAFSVREFCITVIVLVLVAFFDPRLVVFITYILPLFAFGVFSVWILSPRFGPKEI